MKSPSRPIVLSLTAAAVAIGVAAFYGLKETTPASSSFGSTARQLHSVLPRAAGDTSDAGTSHTAINASGLATHSSRDHETSQHESVKNNLGGLHSNTAGPRVSDSAVNAVESTSPGARLRTSGHAVSVESYTPLPGQPGSALSIAVSPVSASDPAPSRALSGFSYEDELFRTKWGWAAYEAVKRAAREEVLTQQ